MFHVEVHLLKDLPSLSIVGLSEIVVKESKDRVLAAILNSHLGFPKQPITINLSPTDLPRESGRFDLSIAIVILAASKQVSEDKSSETGIILVHKVSRLICIKCWRSYLLH